MLTEMTTCYTKGKRLRHLHHGARCGTAPHQHLVKILGPRPAGPGPQSSKEPPFARFRATFAGVDASRWGGRHSSSTGDPHRPDQRASARVSRVRQLAELNAQGQTIVLVTQGHDIAEYSKRQVYLKDGLIEQDFLKERAGATV